MSEYRCTKVEELAELQANQKQILGNVKDIRNELQDLKNIYKLIYELSSNFATLNETVINTRIDVASIKIDVETMKSRPNDRENHYIKVGVGGIITVIIAAIFKILFMG